MDNKNGFAIAIDGPAGVGKSTTARMVAQKLGIAYIDTGAMYRAVALYCTEKGIEPTDAGKTSLSLADIDIKLHVTDGEQRVFLNARDVTDAIRTQQISDATPLVAAHQNVREKLVTQQQHMAANGKVVMDGRDIGTHVLPWAQVKIYLDADVKIRAERRMKELESKGHPADFEKILEEAKLRDHRDKTRAISPLKQAPDAIYLDTGNMSQTEVAEKIICYVNEGDSCSTK